MKQIYSNIDTSVLLLSIIKHIDITNNRIDLSPADQFLQVAVKQLNTGTSFKPHKHNKLNRVIDETHESWVFLSGRVLAKFYDLDDSIILETEMGAGDCVVVFKAGHEFTVLEDNTIIYEFKNGPYYGVEADKTFIKEH